MFIAPQQAPSRPRIGVDIIEKALPILQPKRYKVLWGGRAGTKSHTIARALIAQTTASKLRILCTREFQSNISDSVHRTLADVIYKLRMERYFEIQKRTIINRVTGSEFIFKGLRHNIQEIKSTEGIDRCWVEEAQAVSEESWQVLEPTIRNAGSEMWISFNPYLEADPTYQRFIVKPPPAADAWIEKFSWRDNLWMPPELERLRMWTLQTDQDAYDWIWEGHCRKISEATIFRGRFVVEPFETPEDVDRFYLGADWGFANDPSVLIRCYIRDETLYVDYEAYAVGVEIDDLPALFAGGRAEKNGVIYPGVPGARDWPIWADSSRPETISYIHRRGFNIAAADKWQGSVEDGIAHLKGFNKIVIHPRCENTAQEFRLYSYKTDPKTDAVLPVIVDKFNHCLVAGTAVETVNGPIAIEKVLVGDKVLTRNGARTVSWSGQSGCHCPVMSVIMADGRVLTGTPWHRVFTARGLLPMGILEADDCLYMQERTCQAEGLRVRSTRYMQSLKRLSITAMFTIATRMLRMSIDGCSDPPIQMSSLFTGRFGWTITGLFLTAITSIIKTTTHLTTRRIISSVFRRSNMLQGTLSQKSGKPIIGRFSLPTAIRQRLGTAQRKVAHGIASMGERLSSMWPRSEPAFSVANLSSIIPISGLESIVRRNASISQPGLRPTAQSAAKSSSTDIGPIHTSPAPPNAAPLGATEISARKNGLVSGAASHLRNGCTSIQDTVPNRVLAIIHGMNAEKVYDLTVDQEHEFFANELLVSNSIDSLRYALNGYVQARGGLAVWARLAS